MSKLTDKLLASVNKSDQAKPSSSSAPKAPVAKKAPSVKAEAKPKASPKKTKAATASSYTISHPQRIWPD